MINDEQKKQIIEYCQAWLVAQEKYVAIDGIDESRHCGFPEPLQKVIVKELTGWGLEDGPTKTFDFAIRNQKVEMKSTTKLNGTVCFSEKQFNGLNQLIWFYVDAENSKIFIKKIGVNKEVRKKLDECFLTKKKNLKKSSPIKPIFEKTDDYKCNYKEIVINMKTLEVEQQ